LLVSLQLSNTNLFIQSIDKGYLGASGASEVLLKPVNTTSTDAEKRFYEPVDAADALPCRPDFALVIYPAYLFQKGGFELAPEIKVSPQTPPTFLLQAENDKPHVDSSLAYFIALKAAGVPTELHIYPDGGHGYGLRKRGNSTDAWGGLAEAWLRRLLKLGN
jgi:acetyl esterase/lipase